MLVVFNLWDYVIVVFVVDEVVDVIVVEYGVEVGCDGIEVKVY